MKKIKLLVFALAVVAFSACSEAWLVSEPTNETFTQDQYDKYVSISDHVNGIYTSLCAYGGDHQTFGLKTIDIVSDLLSSDMAMTTQAYGWFVSDAQLTSYMSTTSRNAYFWSFLYKVIKNTNVILARVDRMEKEGELSSQDLNAKAQALTLRAFAYLQLYTLYAPSQLQLAGAEGGAVSMEDYPLLPIYDEKTEAEDPNKAQPLASMSEVAGRIEQDLNNAIGDFEAAGINRDSKQKVDIIVAKALKAKLYLEIGRYGESVEVANDVIKTSGASILSRADLEDNGFNNIDDSFWLWGKNTDVYNKGGLASWWGHVDVHTYSYASAGAIKAMDEKLYKTFQDGDLRKGWFSDKNYAPINKFFADGYKYITSNDSVDRNWLSDDVYLRIEEIHLVAAEAAARGNDAESARAALLPLIKERYTDEAYAAKEAAINSMSANDLLEEIRYQWRIEMWGEGRSLQLIKRYNTKNERGSNHFASSITEALPVIFELPYSESTYNPNLNGSMDKEK